MENKIKYASWTRSYEVIGNPHLKALRTELKNAMRMPDPIAAAEYLVISYLEQDSSPDVVHCENGINRVNQVYQFNVFYNHGVEVVDFYCAGIFEAYTENEDGWDTITEDYPTFTKEDYQNLISAFGLDDYVDSTE